MTKDERMKRFIKEMVKKIKEKYKPERIILFGSHAYGTPAPDSDIDLLIIKRTTERPVERRIRVRHIVDIRKPISFSPIVVTPAELTARMEAGDQFWQEIMTKGKVLYAR